MSHKLDELRARYASFNSLDITDPSDFPNWRQVMEDIEYLLDEDNEHYDDAYDRGYDKGFAEGSEQAKDDAYQNGLEEGREDKEKHGEAMWDKGYRVGYKDCENGNDPEVDLEVDC